MKRRSWLNLAGASACTSFVTLASGCGFRPRGSVIEQVDLGAIFIDVSRGVTLRRDIQAALQERAFRIAENRDAANILLRISDEVQDERILSIQSTGQVSELELSHSVNMQVARSVGSETPVYNLEQSPNRVEVFREYTNDTVGVLGKEQEAQILRSEMREELVRQVVLRAVATLVERG